MRRPQVLPTLTLASTSMATPTSALASALASTPSLVSSLAPWNAAWREGRPHPLAWNGPRNSGTPLVQTLPYFQRHIFCNHVICVSLITSYRVIEIVCIMLLKISFYYVYPLLKQTKILVLHKTFSIWNNIFFSDHWLALFLLTIPPLYSYVNHLA